MYNLLVVDDEEIAVRGIVDGVDWSDLPIGEIMSASDAEEAKRYFQQHKIHLLLSDIDMPNQNGIELLEWVRAHSPETETIFLSGHADFSYARQALQLDSFDYLLKPIDHRHIKATLGKAIEKIKQEELQKQFHQAYEHYIEQWNNQLPVLTERFWQDVLNLRIPLGAAQLERAYSLYQIPLQPGETVQLILISVEHWDQPLSTRDEEIMTYAIKNAGEELIFSELNGRIVQEAGGVLYAVVYPSTYRTKEMLDTHCKQLIQMCKTYLHCEISCYISEAVEVPELNHAMQRLSAIERHYLSKGGTVIWQSEHRDSFAPNVYEPQLQSLGLLLEAGKKEELVRRLEAALRRIEQTHVDPLVLEGYYHGLVYTVYETLMKKSIALRDVYQEEEWRIPGSVVKSLQRFREWAVPFVTRTVDYLNEHHRTVSPFVQKAIAYIEEHVAEELSREDIAAHVYLNAAYLSRLFKKETGQSLTDYITELRISKVKPLLASTNEKISDIAVSVGFCNFSHFTKVFKKMTGMTPNEYRKNYQRELIS